MGTEDVGLKCENLILGSPAPKGIPDSRRIGPLVAEKAGNVQVWLEAEHYLQLLVSLQLSALC